MVVQGNKITSIFYKSIAGEPENISAADAADY